MVGCERVVWTFSDSAMSRQPNSHVANRAVNQWNTGHSSNFVEWLFRLIGGATKPEVIYVLEYSSCDWENAKCTGDPVHCWEYRGNGFQLVDSCGAIDNSNMIASRTPVYRYCLDDQSPRMVLAIWRGLRAGRGIILAFNGDCWKAERLVWKS